MTLINRLGSNEINRPEPHKVLRDFYRAHGIGEEETLDNLNRKHRFMREMVIIPSFLYDKKEPSLSELEIQYLRDQGCYL